MKTIRLYDPTFYLLRALVAEHKHGNPAFMSIAIEMDDAENETETRVVARIRDDLEELQRANDDVANAAEYGSPAARESSCKGDATRKALSALKYGYGDPT